MTYGSSAYSGVPYGGSANSVNEQVFFALGPNYEPDILHERIANFAGPESFYEVLVYQGSENFSGPNGAEYKIYTADDEGVTPQLQHTVGGVGQAIIAAKPIIKVTALVDSSIWVSGLNFWIVGRPYTQ